MALSAVISDQAYGGGADVSIEAVMSATGLGRVKTLVSEAQVERLLRDGRIRLCLDRRDEWPDPDNVHQPGQIIGENVQRHL